MPNNAVIVVDDDRLTRESLCEILSDLGWLARDANGGLAAFASIQREQTDMVVSDVDMPDISGFELLARLQGIQFPAPVILMSARADVELIRRAREAGAVDLLAKPVHIEPFTNLVSSLLPGTENGERQNHG
ncbi:MAG: response regulator [Planctomycetota bacterium]|jgi:DNA-binding NtrC family response regulator|nr:response regulator [Planctomycetota bacterium]